MNKPNFEPVESDRESGSDRKLIKFLQQNQPIAPPASSNLQASIMTEVAGIQIASPLDVKRIGMKKIGLLSAAIVATISLLTFNQFNQRPMQTVSDAESTKLEKSLIGNWHLSDEEFTTSYSLLGNSNYE